MDAYDDSILQFINFQKEAYGGKTFTVNIAVRPLYIPHENISLKPGERIGRFISQGDVWFDFSTEQLAESSFNDVQKIIQQKVIPWFDSLKNTTDLIGEYGENVGTLFWGPSPWKIHDLGFMYLKALNLTTAKVFFKSAESEFEKVGYSWALDAAKRCNYIISTINRGEKKILEFLLECEGYSRQNLGLKNW